MHTSILPVLCASALAVASAAAGAELYKWVDENGVVNYSNTPPPKTAKGKPPTIVDDQISVYTPEKAVTDEIERNRQKSAQKPAPAIPAVPPEPERRAGTLSAPPPALPYDPCANPNDRNCPGVIYDNSPVFQGRRRPLPPLVQPQLPPGTIAGQGAGPGAYIPGQSGTARTLPAAPRRLESGGARVREPERERRDDSGSGHTRGR